MKSRPPRGNMKQLRACPSNAWRTTRLSGELECKRRLLTRRRLNLRTTPIYRRRLISPKR